jgi:hypothetical protein
VPTLEAARAALHEAGIEVFRVKEETIQIAARVRMHLMDAAVSISFGKQPHVQFTVRAQSSDFQSDEPDAMFDRVREATAQRALEHGFQEADARCRNVRDPVDDNRVLDVWYEVTFAKPLRDLHELMGDLRFALDIDKCVARD